MMMKVRRRFRPEGRYVLLGGVVVLLILGVVFRSDIGGVIGFFHSTLPGTDAFLPRSVLLQKIATLEDELMRARYQSVLYTAARADVATLERALALRRPDAFTSARVLAAPPRTHYDTLLIAVDAESAVVLGDTVFADTFALGVVTDIRGGTALVQLFSSPGTERDARIGSVPGIIVLEGTGGGSFTARVPRELPLAVGDIVRDVRTDTVLGVVRAIASRDTGAEQTAYISLSVAPSALRIVSLVHAP